jgi:hypothetical protein
LEDPTTLVTIHGQAFRIPNANILLADFDGMHVAFMYPNLDLPPDDSTPTRLRSMVRIYVSQYRPGTWEREAFFRRALVIDKWQPKGHAYGLDVYAAPRRLTNNDPHLDADRYYFSEAFIPATSETKQEIDVSTLDPDHGYIVCLTADWPPYKRGDVSAENANCEFSLIWREMRMEIHFNRSHLDEWRELLRITITLLSDWARAAG